MLHIIMLFIKHAHSLGEESLIFLALLPLVIIGRHFLASILIELYHSLLTLLGFCQLLILLLLKHLLLLQLLIFANMDCGSSHSVKLFLGNHNGI
mmetsp:Transcript_2889/g.2717  ORF Transcript_2889/g.2717 Transcript_2889/m.2717 type:complete len:95 (+) Transcript_2889:1104-1388(+)